MTTAMPNGVSIYDANVGGISNWNTINIKNNAANT